MFFYVIINSTINKNLIEKGTRTLVPFYAQILSKEYDYKLFL